MTSFYNRTSETAELKRIRDLSFSGHSRMTVVTGRRRIGKTSLVLKALEDTPAVYLFVAKKNEADLCRDFSAAISESLGLYVSEEIGTFQSLFKTLMELSVQKSFSLIIDEFQDFSAVNLSIYSSMQ
jgi:AAA+ ATPase superfamily predicted ATPase